MSTAPEPESVWFEHHECKICYGEGVIYNRLTRSGRAVFVTALTKSEYESATKDSK